MAGSEASKLPITATANIAYMTWEERTVGGAEWFAFESSASANLQLYYFITV